MPAWRRSFWLITATALAASISLSASFTVAAQTPREAVSTAAIPGAKRGAASGMIPIATDDTVETPDTIESPAEVMTLPPALKARLHDALGHERLPRQERFERLIRFVFAADGLGMRYREDATYSVARSYARREANCVGFTLLFLALAREAGLDASAQGIRRTLAWRQDDHTLYRSNHVNVRVVLDARPHTVDFAVEPVIARDPPLRISDQRLLAHFYNNLAMAALAAEDMPRAQALMTTALELDPDYAPNWSNAGVMYLRNGDAGAAGRAYARALALDPREPSALSNMASLARKAGDANAEALFMRRLSQVQQHDPFHQFLQGVNYEQSGDDMRAIEHYRIAIRLYGREPRFHAALALAYYRSGDLPRAQRALERAKALSTGTAREGYEAELESWAGAARTAGHSR